MTDRSSPNDDDLLLDALDADHADVAGLSPSLRAELAGLRAVRSLLDDDAAWGQRSNTDVPPAHLLDAILRAEVAARPDAIRQAIVAAPSTSTSKPLWARLSSWLVGSGVVVGAAAALLITVERAPEIQTAADQAAVPTSATPPAAAPAEVASPPPPAVVAETVDGFGRGVGGAGVVDAVPADAAASGGLVEADSGAKDKAKADVAMNAKAGDEAPEGAALGGVAGKGSLAAARGRTDVDAKQGPAMAEEKANNTLGFADDSVSPPMPTTPSAAPAPSAAPPSEPSVTSASEVRRLFKERLVAKEEARKEAEAPAKAKKSAPSTTLPAPKSARGAAPGYDEMQRDRRAQEANGILVTAENELAHGRFNVAADLAQRAEAAASGTLGLAPASTLARAYVGLKRPADAARVGSRLINGNVGDPQIVDGLLAAARAALDIGDTTLARRLAQAALRPENVDVARRAQAKALLATVTSTKSAPAPVRASEAEAKPAADAPASTSTP